MTDNQPSALARALLRECSAQTLNALSDALSRAQVDPVAASSLRVVVDTARELRVDAEQQAQAQQAQQPAQTLGEALTRDRAAGRR